jgi:hypothetical protein
MLRYTDLFGQISNAEVGVINRKMKKIVLLDFKRTADSSESYYQDMWKGGREAAHSHPNGPQGTGGRSRVGGGGCPVGRRTTVD